MNFVSVWNILAVIVVAVNANSSFWRSFVPPKRLMNCRILPNFLSVVLRLISALVFVK